MLPLSAGDPQGAVALASAMAIVSGIVCAAAELARLGFVTELLSKPIRYGYMNGIAPEVIDFALEFEAECLADRNPRLLHRLGHLLWLANH